ncbi:H(+)-transporting V0 sector ATPase subunit e [Maublancomyces gigas]|uniref:H(+)-transporting V0 sector ATPase subunit e n=1 Tax=Discina gigas TaxID=1032678 RepID=A0ABR3G981_9PEZI
MANGYTILVTLVVTIALSVAAYFLSPKGENQAYLSHSRLPPPAFPLTPLGPLPEAPPVS